MTNYAKAPGALTKAQRAELDDLNQTRWWERAACLGERPQRFFIGGPVPADLKAMCAGCPVLRSCLRDAELLPASGTRGGLTARERKSRTNRVGPYGWQS